MISLGRLVVPASCKLRVELAQRLPQMNNPPPRRWVQAKEPASTGRGPTRGPRAYYADEQGAGGPEGAAAAAAAAAAR
eukprot:CAMPEP_0206366134 /NCGR_PEP_ID=MMETSP0294-20121207/3278_1 /ASSEMBLY_ACC=CAM_ASM_000327 /TAXON_ID=39354 /ORGANISM="Heterosigma akashiwo, Strain CCMP2393" /LENGTH=77 /DNA_ID=CAMNT_0053812155 /DNA_START=41 /DNA_END=271 /DNA_ORIENTATION=-